MTLSPGDVDTSTRRRILDATAEVLSRSGRAKLSLSAVAAEAQVSRPTLYRWFASKEDLISAFSRYERQIFQAGLGDATAGLDGAERLDAALRFIVDYQHSSTGVRMIDIEPRYVLGDFSRIIRPMREGLQRMLSGPDAAVKAAAAIRIAISHYIIRSDDADQFLAQLRQAVGVTSRND
ncbi:TetR/AcrR family transcriptional regulator [Mycolicibacillus parakoreensis]|uniref:TetR/AcrR family transcriptional regulator n=2 Tax=Mycobacteriaceae TaxID=1762 RepID=A0ABY3TWT6_9MYCO|nr:TetR/AcrR family transcriptional regulator [Mycolicibacillus parakoreensis]MCV7316996.1 TetR/AcrR family transcriptional regulator [Mycolicibacillus parakoreensis]ULN51334.1 TetR/AcrR family transcriptional regulator [Mycolicibacillus parakoreensis]